MEHGYPTPDEVFPVENDAIRKTCLFSNPSLHAGASGHVRAVDCHRFRQQWALDVTIPPSAMTRHKTVPKAFGLSNLLAQDYYAQTSHKNLFNPSSKPHSQKFLKTSKPHRDQKMSSDNPSVRSNEDLRASKLFDVSNVPAVVTGGGTGIGLMITHVLISKGARVYG